MKKKIKLSKIAKAPTGKLGDARKDGASNGNSPEARGEQCWEHRWLVGGDTSWHPGRITNLSEADQLIYDERLKLVTTDLDLPMKSGTAHCGEDKPISFDIDLIKMELRPFTVKNKKTGQKCSVLLIDFVNKYVDVLPEENLEGGSQESWGFDEIEIC